MRKTLEDFRRAHDPHFETGVTRQTFHRKVGWKKARRAIVTTAQNSTPVHAKFLATLQYMAKVLGAEILVVPIRYKNPTSAWRGSQENTEAWAPELKDFLWNVDETLNSDFAVMGDLKIQVTNSNPLSGVDALSGQRSCVVGHTRAQSKSVPIFGDVAKFLMTAGAVTVPNYSDTRLGRLAEFHHSQSAVLVEIDGDVTHMRRLNWSEHTGRVIDMGVAYYPTKHETAPPSLALVMGDTHVRVVCPDVIKATFGAGGLVERTRPGHLVWHDLLDGESCNPHNVKDPFFDIALWLAQRSSVRGEAKEACDFVADHTQQAIKRTKLKNLLSVIIPSNHDDFLRRWIADNDWRKLPPENKVFYLETAASMAKATLMGDDCVVNTPDPFTSIFKAANVPNSLALDLGQSFVLGDVELGMHGNNGPNGARGSRQNLRRVARKSIIGHSHSPGEDEGCTQTGTSTRLRQGYTIGSPSSWLNAHVDLNADGKRQLVVISEGDFCL